MANRKGSGFFTRKNSGSVTPTNVGPPNGSRHCGPRHSSDGKRLSASVWRSRYNGCRRCGEETTKLSHWGQYDTQRIYQCVGGLLAVLTMVPWKEMIIALEQLRAGRAVADSRASAPIALPHRHDRGARATISDLDSTSNAPIAPEAEEYSASTNHSKPRSTNDGTMERTQWPMVIQNALDGTHYFCKIRYKAIYWYLIEMIAVRLKTGELRNPKIYEFNPDILYDLKRKKSKKTRSNDRTKTIPVNGIPPPGKKHHQTAAR
jgi:hypothetical protein